ncbi:hypothetical protein J4E85_004323 [Alternaria conjuncta]|uniref:uncharacterized protein n=1 Tax=Alternaria conjuncta TaxID=181017 RepID=UPI00221F80A1|nr:uncharacterized protein J4E85_004323 [Alternaria conjuncta]KAI4931727.1 hypothetical protein J4E85_004323 [Alternaria conjuncta]
MSHIHRSALDTCIALDNALGNLEHTVRKPPYILGIEQCRIWNTSDTIGNADYLWVRDFRILLAYKERHNYT